VFLSVPNALALRELQGTRDTTPVLCRSHPFTSAARGLAPMALCCCKSAQTTRLAQVFAGVGWTPVVPDA